MKNLRPWRESLGLSRPVVVAKLSELSNYTYAIDQATLAKWESGETRVTAEDLEMLAKIYGVSTDRLFFAPGDTQTPELLRLAHEIITTRDADAVRRWLASGQDMAALKK